MVSRKVTDFHFVQLFFFLAKTEDFQAIYVLELNPEVTEKSFKYVFSSLNFHFRSLKKFKVSRQYILFRTNNLDRKILYTYIYTYIHIGHFGVHN